MPQLSLSFWPDAPKLNKQLAEQGFKFDKKVVKKFEQRIDYINKSLTCGELTHSDAFNTAKALADEINHHIQTYVEPVVEAVAEPKKPVKKKAVKKTAKKSTNDKSRSKKTSGKGKRS